MEQAQSVSTEIRRPGLVTFAAIMMFVNGGFSLVWAIQEISSASWIRANLDGFGYANLSSYLWAWGILDLVLAGIAIYVGIDILRGRAFGLIVGLALSSLFPSIDPGIALAAAVYLFNFIPHALFTTSQEITVSPIFARAA